MHGRIGYVCVCQSAGGRCAAAGRQLTVVVEFKNRSSHRPERLTPNSTTLTAPLVLFTETIASFDGTSFALASSHGRRRSLVGWLVAVWAEFERPEGCGGAGGRPPARPKFFSRKERRDHHVTRRKERRGRGRRGGDERGREGGNGREKGLRAFLIEVSLEETSCLSLAAVIFRGVNKETDCNLLFLSPLLFTLLLLFCLSLPRSVSALSQSGSAGRIWSDATTDRPAERGQAAQPSSARATDRTGTARTPHDRERSTTHLQSIAHEMSAAALTIEVVPTTPFAGQKPGTSGLRKTVRRGPTHTGRWMRAPIHHPATRRNGKIQCCSCI